MQNEPEDQQQSEGRWKMDAFVKLDHNEKLPLQAENI